MIKNRDDFLARISFEGIIADFAIVTNLVLYEFVINDISHYAEYILWSMGILQFFALYAVFSGGVDQLFAATEQKTVLKPFRYLTGLFLVLSIGGFLWLGIVADAINTSSAWLSFSINFFVVIFGGWIALGISLGSARPGRFDIIVKYFGPALYLLFSESLLLFSANKVEIPVIIFAVMISYFPIRFLMIVKPPVSTFEIVTGFSAFIFFIVKITEVHHW